MEWVGADAFGSLCSLVMIATTELSPARARIPMVVRLVRSFATLLSYGFFSLTIVLAVAQVWLAGQWTSHSTTMVGTHAGATVLALLCVNFSRRGGALRALVYSLLAIGLCVAVLWTMWWL